MLVVAFEVEVGFRVLAFVVGNRRAGMAAAQHVKEGRAGVEPDVDDVVALGVVERRELALGTDHVFGREPRPRLHAAGLHHRRGAVHQPERVGVELAADLVQKERQRHAPVALPADAPVGPVRDHVVQARPTVLGIEARRLDRPQCRRAQGLARGLGGEHAARRLVGRVHAHEPLRRGAVDHRRLVAPAVRVAVLERRAGEQAIGSAQCVDDLRVGLPDVLATEQRQRRFVDAVALHRVEDVVDRQAVGAAGGEVLDAVGRRGVDDAGAVFGGGVVGKIDRREAVVADVDMRQRVVELEPVELLPECGGEHRAFEAVAREAVLDQRAGQHEQAACGVDERVFERGVEVERLVRRQRPRRRGPDHCIGVLVDGRQAERSGEPARIGSEKAHVDGR